MGSDAPGNPIYDLAPDGPYGVLTVGGGAYETPLFLLNKKQARIARGLGVAAIFSKFWNGPTYGGNQFNASVTVTHMRSRHGAWWLFRLLRHQDEKIVKNGYARGFTFRVGSEAYAQRQCCGGGFQGADIEFVVRHFEVSLFDMYARSASQGVSQLEVIARAVCERIQKS